MSKASMASSKAAWSGGRGEQAIGSLDLDLPDLMLVARSRSMVFHGSAQVVLLTPGVLSPAGAAFREHGCDPQPSGHPLSAQMAWRRCRSVLPQPLGHPLSAQMAWRRCCSALPTPPGPYCREGRPEPTGPGEFTLPLSGRSVMSGIGRIDRWWRGPCPGNWSPEGPDPTVGPVIRVWVLRARGVVSWVPCLHQAAPGRRGCCGRASVINHVLRRSSMAIPIAGVH